MIENKLEFVLNSGIDNEISNIKVIHKVSYCSKCLRLLDNDRVRDSSGNDFCDSECRRDFHLERRQDMDDILSNLK